MGGGTMKLSQVFFVAILVSLAAITVRADGVSGDARVIVGKDGPHPHSVGHTSFFPGVDPNGGGMDVFVNSTSQDIVELIFTATLKKADTITCTPDAYFGKCTIDGDGNSVKVAKGGMVTITFDDPLNGGIPPGGDFFVELNDVHGKDKGGWGSDGVAELDAQPVFTPEPATLLLLLSGFGSIWLRRKRESSPQTNV